MPDKCTKKSYCALMRSMLSEPNRKGIAAVQVANLTTGKVRIAGVAYKRSEKDRGLFLNFCPWCGKGLLGNVAGDGR